MSSVFPSFQSHLDLAHRFWREHLKPGDVAIDATCGNGKDSLVIAEQILTPGKGILVCIDFQNQAITSTKSYLKEALSSQVFKQVAFYHQSHDSFPLFPGKERTKLIVYNLGYLPGGDKSVITTPDQTLKSLKNSLTFLPPGGVISITCYPGHEGGEKEEKEVISYLSSLNPSKYNTCVHKWSNRFHSPSLIIVQKEIV